MWVLYPAYGWLPLGRGKKNVSVKQLFSGLTPKQNVTLYAETEVESGNKFASIGHFTADKHGKHFTCS